MNKRLLKELFSIQNSIKDVDVAMIELTAAAEQLTKVQAFLWNKINRLQRILQKNTKE